MKLLEIGGFQTPYLFEARGPYPGGSLRDVVTAAQVFLRLRDEELREGYPTTFWRGSTLLFFNQLERLAFPALYPHQVNARGELFCWKSDFTCRKIKAPLKYELSVNRIDR